MARELRGAMRGLLVLEAVKYRRSDSYLTGLGGYFANVARSGLPMRYPIRVTVMLRISGNWYHLCHHQRVRRVSQMLKHRHASHTYFECFVRHR